jgi:hypothetical protein
MSTRGLPRTALLRRPHAHALRFATGSALTSSSDAGATRDGAGEAGQALGREREEERGLDQLELHHQRGAWCDMLTGGDCTSRWWRLAHARGRQSLWKMRYVYSTRGVPTLSVRGWGLVLLCARSSRGEGDDM